MTETYSQGKTTVAPDVLVTIARYSALSVTGVSRMAQVPGGVNRLFKRGIGDGVRIEDAVLRLEGGPLGEVLTDERRVDRAIDHDVRSR